MRISIFAKTFYPNLGGMEISTRLMAKELVASGFHITVITSSRLGKGYELDEGYRVVRSDSLLNLHKWLKKSDYLIIRGGVSIPSGLTAVILNRPIVCFHEMSNPLKATWPFVTRHLKQALAEVIRFQIARRARFHIGVSDAVFKYKDLPADAATGVLYNPVPPALWPTMPMPFEEREIDLLFVGRVLRSKGVFILSDALNTLEERGVRLKLGIVGEGPDLPGLRERLNKLVGVQTQFFGVQRDEKLGALYSSARWLVVPSSTHPEGMGMVAAEAMANGTPVIATDQPSLIEVGDKAALIYDRFNYHQLAETIEHALTDRECWRQLSEHAWNERARFSMETYRRTLFSWIASGLFDTEKKRFN